MKTPEKPSIKRTYTLPRLLYVIGSERILPSIQRITLGGENLKNFPSGRNGSHIKVFLPRPGQTQPILPVISENGPIWPEAHLKPITRTYSIRRYRAEKNELDIDFVIHGHNSPASGWARKAKIGDALGIAGPGGPDPLINEAPWHFIAGDMSALPAIAALLEDLPEHSEGCVFIESDNADDFHILKNNTQLQIKWLVRQDKSGLLKAIKSVKVPQYIQSISAFIAGENHAVFTIRDYLREHYGLTKKDLYAVPYWCRGQDEETYHQERHRIMDEVY